MLFSKICVIICVFIYTNYCTRINLESRLQSLRNNINSQISDIPIDMSTDFVISDDSYYPAPNFSSEDLDYYSHTDTFDGERLYRTTMSQSSIEQGNIFDQSDDIIMLNRYFSDLY